MRGQELTDLLAQQRGLLIAQLLLIRVPLRELRFQVRGEQRERVAAVDLNIHLGKPALHMMLFVEERERIVRVRAARGDGKLAQHREVNVRVPRADVFPEREVAAFAPQAVAQFEKGIRVLRDVLPDAVQLHDATVEAQVRERLAEAQRDQGDWPAAIGETERAAKLLGLTDQSLDVRLNDTRLRWKLGRREEAARSLEEAEQLLKKYSNPVNLFLITVLKSEMALEDGQTAKAITLARLALAMKGTGADLRPRALVLLSAALLRGRQEKEALLLASSALTELDKNHRTLEAAQAHLSLAESLAETGQVELARDHALKALAFFEPHRIVEATWRANCVAARGAGQTESNQHRQAALSALANLKTLWPAADVQLYLARPHIKLLLQKL